MSQLSEAAETHSGQDSAAGLDDQGLETAHTRLILKTKFRIADNAVRHIRRHVYLHLIVGLGMVFFLLGGGTAVFLYIFDFLMGNNTRASLDMSVFGAPLMNRLIGIVLLIFFFMLLFSNLIITLSTTYISREVEFLMGLPISRLSIFRQKLIESIIYSSWAFALLSFPLFVSFGISRDAVWYYYVIILLLIFPFLSIPATLGAILTMLMTSWLPARKTRLLLIGLGILSVLSSAFLARVTGVGRILATADQQDFLQIMDALGFGNSPILPSAWLSNALIAIAPANRADIDLGACAYWAGMLISTSLFLFQVCRWLVPPLYYRGWCLSRDASVREVGANTRFSPFRWLDRGLERLFPKPTAGLLSKDLKTFWRDPTQWTQLVILFGLMIVYVMNLGWSRRYSEALELVVNDWKTLLSFFNLAATCFILSILTTRFVYPMLSLEGRGFWTVGLAPVPRSRVVWQKFILCLGLCLAVSVPLTILSNQILQLDPLFFYIAVGMVTLMSCGLTSLSVGIGAILPDFREDNPARIANGIGGTLNVLLSLAYIAVSVVMLAVPTVLLAGGGRLGDLMDRWLYAYIALAILFHVVSIWLPMRVGLRRWRRLEF